MSDPIFANPRLARVYDALEANRKDLPAYVSMVSEFHAESVLDIGCGTGTLACMLGRMIRVIAVDPAQASLDVARAKPGADRVNWLACDAAGLPPLHVDMALMTGNVAQVFLTDQDWLAALAACRNALVAGGVLAFEVRDPDGEAWLGWTRELTFETVNAPNETFDYWVDVLEVAGPLVTFRQTFFFHSDRQELVSDSTLRFRSREEVESSLEVSGYDTFEARGAPDRPGKELVFVART